MSRSTLRQQLADFYAGKSLPPETVSRLDAMARANLAGRPSATKLGRPRRWLNSSVGLAACAGIVVLSASYYAVYRAGRAHDDVVVSVPSGETREGIPSHPVEQADLPKIVAVKFHADWCRRCPTIAPIFAELTEKYAGEPALFVTLDVTSEATRKQARLLASSLGIRWIMDKPNETGAIKLIDRARGEVLATLTEPKQWSSLEGALVQALPREP